MSIVTAMRAKPSCDPSQPPYQKYWNLWFFYNIMYGFWATELINLLFVSILTSLYLTSYALLTEKSITPNNIYVLRNCNMMSWFYFYCTIFIALVYKSPRVLYCVSHCCYSVVVSVTRCLRSREPKIRHYLATSTGSMAVATLGKVEEFDGAKEDWSQYVERLGHFFAANGIDDAGRMYGTLNVPKTFFIHHDILRVILRPNARQNVYVL